MNAKQAALQAIRTINLIAFDICDPSTLQIIRDSVDPLKARARASLTTRVPPKTQTQLRKVIKTTLKSEDALVGRIRFDAGALEITLYLKRLHEPAWEPTTEPSEDS